MLACARPPGIEGQAFLSNMSWNRSMVLSPLRRISQFCLASPPISLQPSFSHKAWYLPGRMATWTSCKPDVAVLTIATASRNRSEVYGMRYGRLSSGGWLLLSEKLSCRFGLPILPLAWRMDLCSGCRSFWRSLSCSWGWGRSSVRRGGSRQFRSPECLDSSRINATDPNPMDR